MITRCCTQHHLPPGCLQTSLLEEDNLHHATDTAHIITFFFVTISSAHLHSPAAVDGSPSAAEKKRVRLAVKNFIQTRTGATVECSRSRRYYYNRRFADTKKETKYNPPEQKRDTGPLTLTWYTINRDTTEIYLTRGDKNNNVGQRPGQAPYLLIIPSTQSRYRDAVVEQK